MRETDISKFTEQDENQNQSSQVKKTLKAIGRTLFTLLMVFVCTGVIMLISLSVYIAGIASEPTGIDLKARGLNQTSFIYVKNDSGKFRKYQSLYSTENREWISYENIPLQMRNAMIAIEDKRFEKHNGVDWTRTTGAVLGLATGSSNYGGSTITQQLIKNLTDDNEVSINRKIREIVKALKLEGEYTKDEILEAYLNVVNFGNNCQGVQAAASLYFDKKIADCSIAECAAIAGITQNPSKYNPLVYPENNRDRREIVLWAMQDQGKISQEEYETAMKESANMKFVGYKKDKNKNMNVSVQNWYIDELFNDLVKDLAVYYNINEEAAAEKLYTEGLKIYSCMDVDVQKYMEKAAMEIDKTYDTGLQTALTLIDTKGRIVASCSSSEEKTGNRLFTRATESVLQPGSSIKPVAVYPYAIEKGELYYSSIVKDEPLQNYKVENGKLVEGPDNWYEYYKGYMMLPDAIEISSNATVAQTIVNVGVENVYNQVVGLQGFSHLNVADKNNAGGLSIGGLNGGVTVREMAAGSVFMANGGLYYEPYTYYYVTDFEGNVILDNRNKLGKQCYSPETAYIINRLLNYNMTYCANTNAAYARISGWDIIGKTGTTDKNKDSWFVGSSPYGTLAVWTGFDQPDSISGSGQRNATTLFQKVMSYYLEDKEPMEYKRPDTIVAANYDPHTGLTYNVGEPTSSKYVGYYKEGNMPKNEGLTVGKPEKKKKKKKPTEATEDPSASTSPSDATVNPSESAPTTPATTEPSENVTVETTESSETEE